MMSFSTIDFRGKEKILFSFFFVAKNPNELKTLREFASFMSLDTIISKEKYFWFVIMRTVGLKQTRLFYKNIFIDFDFKPIFFFVWDFNRKSVHKFVYLDTLEIFLNPISKEMFSPVKVFLNFITKNYVGLLKVSQTNNNNNKNGDNPPKRKEGS